MTNLKRKNILSDKISYVQYLLQESKKVMKKDYTKSLRKEIKRLKKELRSIDKEAS